ncbi:MAG: hypothetical protein PHP37_04550 [Patescibacteria group bacterium]|nr:hypothetical protein [Patescibacteria group bacterium]
MKKIFFKTIKYLPAIICLGLIIFLPQISSAAEPLATSINQDYIKKPWTIVMWLINIISVALLIAIAIGTALRVENLYFKRLLPALIIGLILANFSFLICRIMIDVVQIPTGWIVEYPEGTQLSHENILGLIGLKGLISSKSIFTAALSLIGLPGGGGGLGTLILVLLILLLPVILFIVILWFLLMIRIYVIWFLVIMSPLAFFCLMIPMFQKLWQTWWSWFVKWLLLGFLIIFVLKIGILVTSSTHNLGFSSNIGQWVIGIVTLVLAVYYIPFVFIGGGIMAAWAKAPGKIFSHGAALSGMGVRAAAGGNKKHWLSKTGSWLQSAGNAINPNLSDEMKLIPGLGGSISTMNKEWSESQREKNLTRGATGQINRVLNPEQTQKMTKKDEMGDWQPRSTYSFINDTSNKAHSAEEELALMETIRQTGDEKIAEAVYGANTEEADRFIGKTRAYIERINTTTDESAKQELLSASHSAQEKALTDPNSFISQNANARTQARQQRVITAIRNNSPAAGVRRSGERVSDIEVRNSPLVQQSADWVAYQITQPGANAQQIADTLRNVDTVTAVRAFEQAHSRIRMPQGANPQQQQQIAQQKQLVEQATQIRLSNAGRQGTGDFMSAHMVGNRLQQQGLIGPQAKTYRSEVKAIKTRMMQSPGSTTEMADAERILERAGLPVAQLSQGAERQKEILNLLDTTDEATKVLSNPGVTQNTPIAQAFNDHVHTIFNP